MAVPVFTPPELSPRESYHFYCCYISADSQWTNTVIQQLEDRGLKVCDHERDSTPGCGIIESMSDCIQQSQKLILVLSAEFVRSRWCLLEANMPLFENSLQTKPIVPVLLQQDASIPLHLSHLTYLDVQKPDFLQQLLRVLCTPNQDLQSSTVVPFQPPSLFNGKSLEPLHAVNEEELNRYDCGLWTDSIVPPQLRTIIQQTERYTEAIKIINKVSQKKVKFRSFSSQAAQMGISWILILFCSAGLAVIFTQETSSSAILAIKIIGTIIIVAVFLWRAYKMAVFIKQEPERILRELQKSIGKANVLLLEEKVLLGSESPSKLLLVYVNLDNCRQELSAQYQDLQSFHKVIQKYSSTYTCCLTNRFFIHQTPSPGHLQGSVCFCQFVRSQPPRKKIFNCC